MLKKEPERFNLQEMLWKNFAIVECEKAESCEEANANCKRGVFSETMICDPAKRWMYCFEWKRKLGMVFDKDLGVYILPQWKDELLRRAKQ